MWKNGWTSLKNHNGSFGVLVKISVLIVVTILAFFCYLKKGHSPLCLLLSLCTVPKFISIAEIVVCFQRRDAKVQTHIVGLAYKGLMSLKKRVDERRDVRYFVLKQFPFYHNKRLWQCSIA